MPPESLRCKECKTTYPLDARYVCERASARSRSPTRRAPTTIPPRCGAGSRPARTRCGATPTSCPVQAPPQGDAAGRLDAAAARRPARRAARPARGVDQERRRQPDALVQGSRRVGRARPRPRARLPDDRLRLDRQPRQRRRRPRGGRRARVLRVHPVRPRGAEGPRHRRLRDQPGRRARQLRRRQPALHRALGRARVGVREHQHAARTTPRARRRSRSRPPSSSGSSCPTASSCPIASGSLFTKIARGFEEWLELGLVEGELPTFNGAQAAGCSPVATRVRGRAGLLPAGQAGHDRQVAGDRQPGRRAVRARPRAAHRRLDRLGHRRRDPRGHQAARPDDRHLHRDRRRRDGRGAGQARRSAATSTPTSGSSRTSPARA